MGSALKVVNIMNPPPGTYWTAGWIQFDGPPDWADNGGGYRPAWPIVGVLNGTGTGFSTRGGGDLVIPGADVGVSTQGPEMLVRYSLTDSQGVTHATTTPFRVRASATSPGVWDIRYPTQALPYVEAPGVPAGALTASDVGTTVVSQAQRQQANGFMGLDGGRNATVPGVLIVDGGALELGNFASTGSYIDGHSVGGVGNDFDARIFFSGGVPGQSGEGNILFAAAGLYMNGQEIALPRTNNVLHTSDWNTLRPGLYVMASGGSEAPWHASTPGASFTGAYYQFGQLSVEQVGTVTRQTYYPHNDQYPTAFRLKFNEGDWSTWRFTGRMGAAAATGSNSFSNYISDSSGMLFSFGTAVVQADANGYADILFPVFMAGGALVSVTNGDAEVGHFVVASTYAITTSGFRVRLWNTATQSPFVGSNWRVNWIAINRWK